ncbi:MAG: endonuclease/exonuclease/phosphatase family protein [Bacteroidales bacterium]|nr:endonuclease/exonuclease/phosphatase family protein [Bacteroidales bacterium]MDE7128028.1 endonuclease/exonuclease/phosphatase family protein [Bacteroidales bacterium]
MIKRFCKGLAVASCICLGISVASAEEVKVLSFNIRFITPKDEGERSWQVRRDAVVSMVRDVMPDVIGIQEQREESVRWLRHSLPEYEFYVPDEEENISETGNDYSMVIMWRSSGYRLIDKGRFFLSETPSVPSKGWNSNHYRSTSWVLLCDRVTGKRFYLFDTHLDHKDTEAKQNGAALNVEMIKSICREGVPVFLVGDMNVQRNGDDGHLIDPCFEWMKSAAETALVTDRGFTFNGYGDVPGRWLDYIFHRNASPVRYEVVRAEYNGVKYISDHYPIACTFRLDDSVASVDFPSQTYPGWLDTASIYHIYPSSFMDSNGDGYGDLEGIRSRLDYVKWLGFNTIWISPVFCSEFEDGGYDITDFYRIDPRFGTNSDLVRLVDDAHSKGMKVCLDLVAGHTSDKHPWFRESAEGDRNGHYSDYYIWTDGKGIVPPEPDRGGWVDNSYSRDGFYLMNYYDIQPALNYGYYSPDPSRSWEHSYDAPGPRAVRQEIKNIISFWFDKGVDGFRCDLAWSLVKGDDSEFHGVRKLWSEIFQWQQENYPETIFLSEWSSPIESISCGFDIDIIRHNGMGKTMYRDLMHNTLRDPDPETGEYPPKDCWFDKAGKGDFSSFSIPFEKIYEATRGQGFPCMPTSSHDTWRMNRNQRSGTDELKTSMAFFLTMPWVPILYYGEEIGMRSMDGVKMIEGSRDRSAQRTPMQWSPEANAGFSSCSPDGLYLPVDPSPDRPNVEAQKNDPESLLNWTRGLLALRRNIPALGNSAGWKMVTPHGQSYPVVYDRFDGDEHYLVIINPRSETAEAIVEGYAGFNVIYGNPKAFSVSFRRGSTILKVKGVNAIVCRCEKIVRK